MTKPVWPALISKERDPLRVAFVNTHPIQYFAPLYAYLNRAEDLSITALYLSDYSIRGADDHAFGQPVKWDINLLDGYEARFISKASCRNEARGFLSMIAPQLWQEVRAGRFDALVVHGHTPAAMLIGAIAAKVSGGAVFMRCDTHLGLPRSKLRSALRQPLLTFLYKQLDGVLAIGSANATFYRAMGVSQGRIFSMPYSVDNDRFRSASHISAQDRRQLRSAFGVIDDRPILLFVGKFQRGKRANDLLCAAELLSREGTIFHLVMVGSGEMESELRDLSQRVGSSKVHFAGFVNQDLLPKVYAACDIFVLPSDNEAWGLTVNEAMCVGLPIVASAEIGCAPDLVQPGQNGQLFAAHDIEGLANALRPLILDSGERRKMALMSREIISRWSYFECLTGLRTALASVGFRT
jgi:glycosyltransferase involved in cell wall biosynthesis